MLRMIGDGDNVILSDDLKTKLYMTATEDAEALSGDDGEDGKKRDPTFGMTPAQKERYEKKMMAKPRPRDIFNVEEIMKERERKIIERKLKQQERKQARH